MRTRTDFLIVQLTIGSVFLLPFVNSSIACAQAIEPPRIETTDFPKPSLVKKFAADFRKANGDPRFHNRCEELAEALARAMKRKSELNDLNAALTKAAAKVIADSPKREIWKDIFNNVSENLFNDARYDVKKISDWKKGYRKIIQSLHRAAKRDDLIALKDLEKSQFREFVKRRITKLKEIDKYEVICRGLSEKLDLTSNDDLMTAKRRVTEMLNDNDKDYGPIARREWALAYNDILVEAQQSQEFDGHDHDYWREALDILTNVLETQADSKASQKTDFSSGQRAKSQNKMCRTVRIGSSGRLLPGIIARFRR